MEKMVIIGIMVFAVTSGYAYARMGGGMMGQGGTMMQGLNRVPVYISTLRCWRRQRHL